MTTLKKLAEFDPTHRPPLIVLSEYIKGSDGSLEHWIDDKLRAVVAPEGWDDYCRDWPSARDAVDALRSATDLQTAMQAMLAMTQTQAKEVILPTQETPQEPSQAPQEPAQEPQEPAQEPQETTQATQEPPTQ